MSDQGRSASFASREGNRYWWFRQPRSRYVPPVYAFLSDEEWRLLESWYEDTDRRFDSSGECNVPTISLLQGLVMGSAIGSIVQLGHFQGYSTLLLGFMTRRMGFPRSVLSIDIDPAASAYTQDWVDRAGLGDYVRIVVADSSAADLPGVAREYFGRDIGLVFVDSSHAYRHTLQELSLWYDAVGPGGLLVLHDVSRFAVAFDGSGGGGVGKAVDEWRLGPGAGARAILLNRDFVAAIPGERLVFGDPCGAAIIQKPFG